jgi:UDP-N-acetylmuramoylalanine--D-glutamate ligase
MQALRIKIAAAGDLARDFECEFGGHSDKLLGCEYWIVSPGIPLNVPIIVKGKEAGIEMISEIEFGYRIKSSDSVVVAITGSNGKSTTVSLIHHILLSLAKRVSWLEISAMPLFITHSQTWH